MARSTLSVIPLGVGPLELLIAQRSAYLVEALPEIKQAAHVESPVRRDQTTPFDG